MSNIERERLTDAIVKRLPRPETGNRGGESADKARADAHPHTAQSQREFCNTIPAIATE